LTGKTARYLETVNLFPEGDEYEHAFTNTQSSTEVRTAGG
jgi:hypothetical protein